MKKYLMALTVLMAIEAGCATAPQPGDYENSVQSRMSVKKTYGTRYNMSREEGERRLMELAEQSELEDAWMFVKRGDECFWVDTGTKLDRQKVSVNMEYVKDVLEPGDEVTFYHIHPKENNNLESGKNAHYMTRPSNPSHQDYVSDAGKRMQLAEAAVRIESSAVAVWDGVYRYEAPAKDLDWDDVSEDKRNIESAYCNRHIHGDKWKQEMKERGYKLSFKSGKDYQSRKRAR